jgi:hypothetical protein
MAKLNFLISIATLIVITFLTLKSSLFETASPAATVLRSQSTTLPSPVQAGDISVPEELQSLRLQVSKLTDMVRELSLQVASNSNNNTVSNSHATPSQATLEADARGAEFVDQMIAQGVIEGNNKQLLHQYMSQMSQAQREKVTQSIARAVNEQRLQFDPTSVE